jgi:melibiose permease
MENVMLADAVDYGEWRTGRRNEGVIFSMLTFLSKIANGVSQGLTFGAFALVGFRADADAAPTTQAVLSFKVLLFAVPVVFLLLAALLHHKKFRLKPALVQTISQELLARRAAADAEETEVLS